MFAILQNSIQTDIFFKFLFFIRKVCNIMMMYRFSVTNISRSKQNKEALGSTRLELDNQYNLKLFYHILRE